MTKFELAQMGKRFKDILPFKKAAPSWIKAQDFGQ
jgi:hypothetical protein